MQRALSRAALLLLLAAAPAFADSYIYVSGGDSFRLTDEPCPVTSGWLKLYRAEIIWKGKTYQACWALVKTVVIVLDEGGDITPIPMGVFQKEKTT